MKKVIFFCLIILLAAISSCKKDNNPVPPENQPEINLTLEDVSCTEAWIKLSTSSLTLPADVELYKDSSLAKSINLTSSDTILYIDSLLPDQSYSFHSTIQFPQSGISSRQVGTQHSINSASLLVTTLDSTSHDYNFQVYLFGEHQQSIIRDIAIIDQNDIWAVGAVYLLDSLGQTDPHAYNVLHWDGSEWEIKRVYFPSVCGSTNQTPFPAAAISVLDDGQIWISSTGDKIAIIKDGSQINTFCLPWSFAIKKIWGTSSQDIYVVGNNGNIVHYNEESWSRMESGTTVDLLDIWGSSGGTLWSCGYTSDYGTTVLLRNSGNGWVKVFEGSSSEQNNGYYINQIAGIWSKNDYRIYLLKSDGIFIQKNNDELFLQKQLAGFTYGGYDINGTDDNNIFVSGYRFIGHWNGVTYREYPELYKENRQYLSIKTKNNIVCAGGMDYNGFIYSQAVIVLSD